MALRCARLLGRLVSCFNFTPRQRRFASLSHVDSATQMPTMVDVSAKHPTQRTARAQSRVVLPPEVASLVKEGDIRTKKGAVCATAVVAGTMAVKKTSEIIPLCHLLPLDGCKITIDFVQAKNEANVEAVVECSVSTTGKTGVEMEALVGSSVAALTVYDMLKAISHNIVIKETKLLEKTGGKSDYRHKTNEKNNECGRCDAPH